jgi:hypothetical protein
MKRNKKLYKTNKLAIYFSRTNSNFYMHCFKLVNKRKPMLKNFSNIFDFSRTKTDSYKKTTVFFKQSLGMYSFSKSRENKRISLWKNLDIKKEAQRVEKFRKKELIFLKFIYEKLALLVPFYADCTYTIFIGGLTSRFNFLPIFLNILLKREEGFVIDNIVNVQPKWTRLPDKRLKGKRRKHLRLFKRTYFKLANKSKSARN